MFIVLDDRKFIEKPDVAYQWLSIDQTAARPCAGLCAHTAYTMADAAFA